MCKIMFFGATFKSNYVMTANDLYSSIDTLKTKVHKVDIKNNQGVVQRTYYCAFRYWKGFGTWAAPGDAIILPTKDKLENPPANMKWRLMMDFDYMDLAPGTSFVPSREHQRLGSIYLVCVGN